MSKLIKSAALFVALGLIAGIANAQDKTITIHSKKNKEGKYTIVVDGDKVTINGKPAEEFKSEGITITNGAGRIFFEGTGPGEMFKGGWNMAPGTIRIGSNKALLGVSTEKTETGVKIIEVSKETAAEKAGLQKRDIITKINDTKIETPEGLYKTVSQFKPEDKVDITYTRDGKENKTTAVLTKNIPGSRSAFTFPEGQAFDFKNIEPGLRNYRFETVGRPKMGMQIKDLENEKGVLVTEVAEESAAAKAGLKKDDIITSIGGNPINSVADARKELASRKGTEEIKVVYLRNNKSQTTTIKFPKKLEEANL